MSADLYDAVIIGGGPAGAVAGALLSRAGRRVVVVDRAVHPREHVGESLTPSCNAIFERLGVLREIEEAGFVRKPGAAWTAPDSPVGKCVTLRLAEVPIPGAPRPYAFNVEREDFDALLLSAAGRAGAVVLQGVTARAVLFEADRAVGVRVGTADGFERDLRGRFIIDASGRRCLLGSQLGLKRIDPSFHQVAAYSWYEGVAAPPAGTEGMLFLHFLGLEQAWAWQIPLRDGITSVGIVADRGSFDATADPQAWIASMSRRSRNLDHALARARPVRPFRIEGDYSYRLDRLTGPGWLLIGDALRFVDPVFSTGVDVAVFSALLAAEAVNASISGANEGAALADFENTMSSGVEVWYDLISLFYRLQNLFTFFAMKRSTRAAVIRVLQGNPYLAESQHQARQVISMLEAAERRVRASPENLLRPWALSRHPQTRSAPT